VKTEPADSKVSRLWCNLLSEIVLPSYASVLKNGRCAANVRTKLLPDVKRIIGPNLDRFVAYHLSMPDEVDVSMETTTVNHVGLVAWNAFRKDKKPKEDLLAWILRRWDSEDLLGKHRVDLCFLDDDFCPEHCKVTYPFIVI
jgi:hypothetical protein